MAKTYLSADTLREHFTYDPETGHFIRRTATQKFGVGSRAGHIGPYGYWCIGHEKAKYLAHRLAFIYMTGELPKFHVDHINGNRLDNRWGNLRDVSRTVNQQNFRRVRVDSRSGLQGVQRINVNGKWRARIRLNGKYHHIGCFATPEDAHEAYLQAKRKLHEGCTI